MRKKLIWIWLTGALIIFVVYVGLQVFFDESRGRNYNLLEKSIVGIFVSLFSTSGALLACYSVFPRSKYLENKDSAKPSFKVTCTSEIDISQEFNFSRLKTEIADKWVITFSDDNQHVLKFRTEFNIFKNMGAAAWLKFDVDTGKIQLECFPMAVMHDNAKKLAQKLQKEIEQCLKNIPALPNLKLKT
jgi:hypothetical protein